MASPSNFAVQIVVGAVDQASKVFGAILNKWTALGAALGAAISGKGLADATAQAMDFEQALDLIQSKTNASAEEMKLLEAAALKAGSETSFSATEAANALSILGAAGLNATDSIATLPSVLALAASEAIPLEKAAGLVTDTVTIMGLSFQESARATDVMVAAANLSSVSATQMGESLKYAGASAKLAGLDIEQTAAVLDVLASNGLRGEQAGTSLRNILAQLGDPAGKARQELAALGITTGDLSTVVDGLKNAGPQAGAAIRAFGMESGPAMQALISGGSAAINDYTAKLREAGGAAQTAASVMSDNLSGAFTGLQSAWDTLSIVLTKPLLEPIKEQVTALTEKFRTAATDGSLTAFSDALVGGFNAAVTQGKAFVAAVDWQSFGQTITDFAANAGRSLQEFADSVSKARAAATLVTESISLMVSGFQTTFNAMTATAKGLVAEIIHELGVMAAGLSKITFGDLSASFKQTADDLERKSQELTASVDRDFSEMDDAYQRSQASLKAIGQAWDDITKPAKQSAEVQIKASQDTASAMSDAEKHLQAFIQSIEDKAKADTEAAAKAAEAAQATRAAEDAKQQALNDTLNELAGLQAAYQSYLDLGDMSNAAKTLAQIDAIKGKLAGTGAAAEGATAAVADAFAALGITSQATLNQLATNAQANFETIRQSGTAAPLDVQNAFIAYANAAIAANNGVANSALRAQAAMQGLSVQASASGDQVIAKNQQVAGSSQQVSDGNQQVVQSSDEVQVSYGNVFNAADRAAGANKRFGDSMDAAAAIGARMVKALNWALDGLRQYSEGAASAVNAIIQSMGSWNEKVAKISGLQAGDFIDSSSVSQAKDELAKLEAGAEAAEAAADKLHEAQGPFKMLSEYWRGIETIKRFEVELAEAAAQAKRTEIAAEEMGGKIADLSDQFDRGEIGLTEYLAKLERLKVQYGQLGDERLEPLRDAIADAREKMDDFADSAKEGLTSLQQEWAELNGQQIQAAILEQQMERLKLEAELAQAKRDGNQEAIAALQAQLVLLDQIHAKQLQMLADEEASRAIKAAEDAADEAARRANLSDEERAHEDLINSLKAQLANAIKAQDAALKASILAQIEAEKQRHEQALANIDKERRAKADAAKPDPDQEKRYPVSGTQPTATAPIQPVRTVNVNLTGPKSTGTVRVLEGDEDILDRFLRALETGKSVT